MPVALILIGALLIIVAFNNTMGELATELETDIPGFFVWAVAIAAILGLGYIPGFKQPSRWLLGLVVLVIVLTNYQKILSGFTTFAKTGGAATAAGAAGAPPNPATAYASSTAGTPPPAGDVSGMPGGSTGTTATAQSAAGGIAGAIAGPGLGALGAASQGAVSGVIANYTNPASYLTTLETAIGFGGLL
jgi:hypothetical protein